MLKELWESMLDADMNTRYWSTLARRYSKRDTYSKIFLAVMSSSAVAGWSIWIKAEWIWQTLSAVSALIAIALPILNMQKSIQKMSDLAGKWIQIKIEYESLWLERKASKNFVIEKYKDIKKREADASKIEHTLPADKNLIIESYNDVLRSRGLLNA